MAAARLRGAGVALSGRSFRLGRWKVLEVDGGDSGTQSNVLPVPGLGT